MALDTPEMTAIMIGLLESVHPELPAAVGHAMAYAVEDESGDPLLLDLELRAAARAFYDTARELTEIRPNGYPICKLCHDEIDDLDEAEKNNGRCWDCRTDDDPSEEDP